MKTEHIEYQDGDIVLEGFAAYDEKSQDKRPGIMICHDWSGRNPFAENKAKQLAELGYVGFAIDMYGKGKLGKTTEEKSAFIQPFMQDRLKLQKRVLAGFEAIKRIAAVDSNKIGAIGFCFGGLCALDLARSGADVKGVVSFHGLLNAPEGIAKHTVIAKVLALHGYDDPLATPDQVFAFAQEMTHSNIDWQLDMYGHTKHAFTNPEAHDTKMGLIYDKRAADRSWIAMKEFFKETF